MALKIEYLRISEIREYKKNARTHSPDQIAQIIDSINEFGFTNPVLVDENNELIAGHGRTQAAKAMGLKEVPAIRWGNVSKSMRRNGAKDVLCDDCGTEFTVRKDTNPIVCRRCASVRGGKAHASKPIAERWRRGVSFCKECGSPFRKSLGYSYCSIECRRKAGGITRTCKHCKTSFRVSRSRVNGKSNSSGNFCSRKCYNKWLCQTDRISGRGSRWGAVRKEALRRQPFCAVCGRIKNLQVHHIVPFRINQDNRQVNLVPLCAKHHKHVETLTHDIEATGLDPLVLLLFMRLAMNESAQVISMKLSGAKRHAV